MIARLRLYRSLSLNSICATVQVRPEVFSNNQKSHTKQSNDGTSHKYSEFIFGLECLNTN